MPVPVVNIVSILFLLVVESLICNIEDGVHHLLCLYGLSEFLGLSVLLPEEVVSLSQCFYLSVHLLLHRVKHLLLLEDSVLDV